MKIYDLWSLHPGNLIAEYDSEGAALAQVRELLADGWPAENLSLGWADTDDDEQGGEIANGPALATLAGVTDERTRRSA